VPTATTVVVVGGTDEHSSGILLPSHRGEGAPLHSLRPSASAKLNSAPKKVTGLTGRSSSCNSRFCQAQLPTREEGYCSVGEHRSLLVMPAKAVRSDML
jgi:hypothetical protein